MSTEADFVRAATELSTVEYLPELRLYQAPDVYALWEDTERRAGGGIGPPPFWAFAWPGGQALARHLLDHPETVAGRAVFDLAAGGGVVAIAAARAGAAAVVANDIDRYALAAIELNARANGVTVEVGPGDRLDSDAGSAEVVLTGDVFYNSPMAQRVLAFLDRAAARGADVLIGDPGRAYLPDHRLTRLSTHDIPVNHGLEDADRKRGTVWRLVRSSG